MTISNAAMRKAQIAFDNQSPPEDDRDRIAADREKELWADDAFLSEFIRDSASLECRDAMRWEFQGTPRHSPAITTGREAMRALRAKDFAEFGRIVYDAVRTEIEAAAMDYAIEQIDARPARNWVGQRDEE